MDVYINGKKINLSPQKTIGKGGEADIFDIGNGQAAKIFKQPNHPDYQGQPFAQQAAVERIKEHQIKLRQFPHNLPSQVIAPQELATDKSAHTILGYTMPFLKGTTPLFKYSDRALRNASGINNETIIEIFQNLHNIVKIIHTVNVVIGDFNDLNVLISGTKNYLIDADSFQYGTFLCRVYTTRFVDPILCDNTASQLILNQAHNFDSDWYAFTVMLMQCLLFVDPYGGIYKPKNQNAKIPHNQRPLKRITVFNSEVKYPKPAIPYQSLSDELLQHFHRCFEKDQRGEFPRKLLDNLHWEKCPHCGIEHLRSSCPNCTHITVQIVAPQTITVRGNVTATHIFRTEGVILAATLQGDTINWLYYEKGVFKREDNTHILTGNLDEKLYFWLHNEITFVGKQGQVISLYPVKGEVLAVDSYQEKPMFFVTSLGRYWLHNGQLLKDGKLGAQYMGDVLQGQTQFWVGSRFGFGFYRAGNLNVAFVFDAKNSGINDQVKLPIFSGELIDANCVFSDLYCWFFIAIQEQGKILHRVFVICSDGQVIATAQGEKGDQSWLSNIRGKFAIGNFILAATDEGIVRIETHNNQLIKTKEFPDTEPFVNANCQLLAAPQGLYMIEPRQIILLKITHP